MIAIRQLRPFRALAFVCIVSLLPILTNAQAQEPAVGQRIARTGVFFRADAPAVLRNNSDPSLPIVIQIINGVEKTGLSEVARLARNISRDPVFFEGVRVYAKPNGASRRFADSPIVLNGDSDFTYDARRGGKPFSIVDRMDRVIEIPREAIRRYLSEHFIGGHVDDVNLRVEMVADGWPSQDFYLRVKFSAPDLPEIKGWYRGDIHYHSAFTDNPAERGYPLGVTKQAALAAGLRWVLLSDHSTDLDGKTFSEEQQDAARYRDGRFVFITGEEVSATSGTADSPVTLHVLALPSPENPDKGFPDPSNQNRTVIESSDGSVASPALPLPQVLLRIAAAGGFAYAAHPDDPISPLLRGGSWNLETDFLAPGGKTLLAPLVGLEPWNRATTATAENTRDPFCIRAGAPPETCFRLEKEIGQYERLEKAVRLTWLPLLQKSLESSSSSSDAPAFKPYLAAGSDAHGDLNYESTMDVVDFLSGSLSRLAGYAEDNALGKVTTVVRCPHGMGGKGENVLRALREGESVLSNGPLVVAGFDRDQDGSLDGAQDAVVGQETVLPPGQVPPLMLEWVSNNEFGPFTSIKLIVGTRQGEEPAIRIEVPAMKSLASSGLFPLDLRGALKGLNTDWDYLRLEARTRNAQGDEFRCYTNPIWIRAGSSTSGP